MDDFKQLNDSIFKNSDLNYFKGGYLAGGAITSTYSGRKIRDYDLYFKTQKDFEDAVRAAFENYFWCVAITKRAITFINNNKTVYQFMCFDWFENAEKIFQKFDFTACMAAIDLESREFFRHKRFLADISRRALSFNHNTEYPLGSALRVMKYKDRGYTIEPSEFLKVVMACAFKQPKDWDDLKNQVGGQYGEAVVMDTSKEFNLENAIESLTNTIVDLPAETVFQSAKSADEALKTILGDSYTPAPPQTTRNSILNN